MPWLKKVPPEYLVYALIDIDKSIRYVGATSMPIGQRVSNHVQNAKRDGHVTGKALRTWLLELEAKPEAVILEKCRDRTHLAEREALWIGTLEDMGLPLLNTQLINDHPATKNHREYSRRWRAAR